MAMRNQFQGLAIGALLVCIGASYPSISSALDTSVEERTCSELGFKKKTPAFANCVLELYERKNSGSGTSQTSTVQNGDGTQDDQTCQRYGFRPGRQDYSNCRMQIDIAKQQAAREQQRYQAELSAYQKQAEEAARDRRQARALRQLETAFGMMAGQGAGGGGYSNSYSAPPPRSPLTNQTIRLPNGNYMYCQTLNGNTDCR
jgi:hypothetical protein